MDDLLNIFAREIECVYKEERYSVRDNGAVMRHPREGKKARVLDGVWTFGKTDAKTKYMYIGSARVHIIVAKAFHGEPPTPQHIVDHIDTNRCNNRPENLRWLTKLENALNNPITRKRIIIRCGSIEAFLENPSLLRSDDGNYTDIAWMRTVTQQEAENLRKRLTDWAKEDKVEVSGGKIGEWIYTEPKSEFITSKLPKYLQSLTPNAVQANWNTLCEFPFCPHIIAENPITDYANNLIVGERFCQNELYYSTVANFALADNNNSLLIKCRSSSSIKDWSLAKIIFEDGVFVHISLGTFFSEDGVDKQFTLEQGLEWNGEDSIDDYC